MSGEHFKAPIVALALGLFVLPINAATSASVKPSTDETGGFTFPGFEADTEPRFLQFDQINVPVVRNGKAAQIISIVVTVEVKGYANKTKVMEQSRQLRDAFLRDIHGVASYQRADGRIIDPQVVKARLLSISRRIMGPDVIENILVHGMTDRSPR